MLKYLDVEMFLKLIDLFQDKVSAKLLLKAAMKKWAFNMDRKAYEHVFKTRIFDAFPWHRFEYLTLEIVAETRS